MPFRSLVVLTAFALVALLLGGFRLYQKASSQKRGHRLLFGLMGIGIALLLLIFALEPAWYWLLLQPGTAKLTLSSPLILGGLGFVITAVFGRVRGELSLRLWLCLTCLALLGLLASGYIQPYGLLGALLPGALLLGGVSLFWGSGATLAVLISLLLLIFMGISGSGATVTMLDRLPAWFGLVLRPLLFSQASLAVLASVIFVYRVFEGFDSETTSSGQDNDSVQAVKRLILCLAGFLLVKILYTVYWVSVMDRADNGLGGVWMAITGGMMSLGAGGLMIERARGRLRRIGFLYLLPMTALFFVVFAVGIHTDYHAITERRAALIQQAVQSFSIEQKRFPSQLDELVPRYLVWVPRQLILRNEDWCFQGGSDYYRLGVFWRPTFTGLLEAREYASSGNPPDEGWVCLEKLEAMKFKYDPMPFMDTAP